MELRKLIAPAALALAALPVSIALAGVETTDAAHVPAGSYEFDPSHAAVFARINHFGFSSTTVHFSKLSGRFTYDPAHAETSILSATLDAASLSTDWDARDTELKGAGYFNVAKYPTIQFTSSSGLFRSDSFSCGRSFSWQAV